MQKYKAGSSSPLRLCIPRVMLAVLVLSLSILHATAFQPTARTPTKQRSGIPLLQYRRTAVTDDDIDQQPILMQLASGKLSAAEGTIVSSSPTSFLQMMAAHNNDLSAMNEYLEYVDKRYARMYHHQTSLSSSSLSPVAAAAATITTTIRLASNTHVSTATIDEEAPLKALGLSRLSAQQRHRLRKQHDKSTIMMLIARYLSRFLQPFSYLCGAFVVFSCFIRSNGYYS